MSSKSLINDVQQEQPKQQQWVEGFSVFFFVLLGRNLLRPFFPALLQYLCPCARRCLLAIFFIPLCAENLVPNDQQLTESCGWADSLRIEILGFLSTLRARHARGIACVKLGSTYYQALYGARCFV
jgi:hypothetical protein